MPFLDQHIWTFTASVAFDEIPHVIVADMKPYHALR